MRSAEAVRNTSAMIEGSINSAKKGVAIGEEVARILADLTTAAANVYSLIDEITAASQEQQRGIRQINSTFAQIDGITQTNAAAAERSANSAHELSAQASRVSLAVDELITIIHGQEFTG